MAGELESYIDLFNEADKLYRTFYQALTKLQQSVALAMQGPQGLVSPSAGKWPTQDQIRELYETFSQKMVAVYATYQRLPHEYRAHAPEPDSVGKR